MMEELVSPLQGYSVKWDSLVEEDAQGRQESFDSVITAVWLQWGQLCLWTKIQQDKNTVLDVSLWWAHMEEKTGPSHCTVNFHAPGTKLTSRQRDAESGKMLYWPFIRRRARGKIQKRKVYLEMESSRFSQPVKSGAENKIKCNYCKIVSFLPTQVGDFKSCTCTRILVAWIK